MATSINRVPRKNSIKQSDPGRILDLITSLTGDTCTEIQVKINAYLCEECEADLVFQLIVNLERHQDTFMEAVGKAALPRKMKINLSHILTETLRSKTDQTEFLNNFDEDILTLVKPYLHDDDPKKRVTLMPVYGRPFAVIFCVVGPKITEGNVPVVIHECILFAWPTLKKTIVLEYERTLKVKCQQLLRVAKRLFTQVASLETLLQMAMDQAKHLLKAEYCVVMLIDVDKMELYESCSPLKSLCGLASAERRFPMNIGMTGEVIKTGAFINSRKPTEHPLYDPSIDCLPDIKCRNILCFPIREQSGIIGVGQAINKLGEPYFDGMDEEMALAFSIYCGSCIIHSAIYQKIQEAHIRNALATELVMYHIKVGDDDVTRLTTCTGFHNHPHIASLHFNPRALPLRELPCYVLKMFTDFGFDKKFDIKTQKLARFILYVKKGYRDVPYHNWTHAFNVCQWAYAALKSYKLISQGYFNDLQALMFLVASLVHDIDHRGTTSSFQVHGHTNLAVLYSSEGSVMERHHLAQAMCIINTEGCNILESLPRGDFDRAIVMLRDNIVATDLSNYFKNLPEYQAIALNFQKENKLHFNALQALLMSGADLSDQIKEWGCVKKTAAAVMTEFFKQGELEKVRGVKQSMDRDKCSIPELEMEFLQTTIMPLYELIGQMLPQAGTHNTIIEAHLDKWEFSKPVFKSVSLTAGLSALLSPELDTLIELNKLEAERLEQERLEAELLAAQKAKEEAEAEESE